MKPTMTGILIICNFIGSHPTRVRGLKQAADRLSFCLFLVAPHAGAWIETYMGSGIKILIINVAPHAGAWIETVLNS